MVYVWIFTCCQILLQPGEAQSYEGGVMYPLIPTLPAAPSWTLGRREGDSGERRGEAYRRRYPAVG